MTHKINKLCGRPAQYASAQACKLTISLYLFARWHLFRHVGYLRHQQQVDLLTLKVVSESRVTANFCLPRPLCSQLRPDVHDRRQTASSLNASLGWGIISPIRPGFFKMIVFRKLGDQCSIIVLLIIVMKYGHIHCLFYGH